MNRNYLIIGVIAGELGVSAMRRRVATVALDPPPMR